MMTTAMAMMMTMATINYGNAFAEYMTKWIELDDKGAESNKSVYREGRAKARQDRELEVIFCNQKFPLNFDNFSAFDLNFKSMVQ